MAARYGLTDEEIAAGYVLTCQRCPRARAWRWITTCQRRLHADARAAAALPILPPLVSDSLQCRSRPDKIDVGVGVYRDAPGGTPILRAVKAAERILSRRRRPRPISGSPATSASPS
jgi:hypothetical protein